MILTDEDIQGFNGSLKQDSIKDLTKTRQFRKMMRKVDQLISKNKMMSLVVLDLMYCCVGRIRGFPEEKSISYTDEVEDFWGYLIEKIDSCTEKKDLYNRLMMVCIIADRLNRAPMD